MESGNILNPAALASLDPKTGAAPKRRITEATQVREMFVRARRDNDKRSKRNALVGGLVDGNPPYSEATLTSAGQNYRSNFNNGEAESFLNISTGAFYDLFSETEQYAVVSFPQEIASDPMSKDWSDRIQEEFDQLLRTFEDEFDFNIQLSQSNMVLYGWGPMIWDDAYDHRPKAVAFRNVYLPRRAPAQVKEWPWLMIYCDVGIDDLYKRISDPETATAAGWDIEACKKAIIASGSTAMSQVYPNSDWSRWEVWQEQLRNNELAVSDASPPVYCIRLFYKEFSVDGRPPKISEVWAPFFPNPAAAQDVGFLFKSFDLYDNMEQACTAFFYDRGTGQAHSVRGLGVKMYKLLFTKMRLQNATVDSAFARSSIMLQQESNDATLSPIHLGPYTVLPSGVTYVANTAVPGIIDAPLAVARDLDNTLAANTSQYRQRLDQTTTGNPRTAYEIAQNVHQASLLNKTQISRYYNQLDSWYREIYRRATNENIPKGSGNEGYEAALKFQQTLRKANVPKEAITKARVRAFRVVGQGSALVRTQQLESVYAGLSGELPEDGRERLKRDIIAAKVGFSGVDRYMPDRNGRTLEMDQRWEAQIENGVLRQGGAISLAPGQNDTIHLDEHLVFASQAAQSLQQGADLEEVYKTIEAVGSHMVLHLQRLSRSPARAREVQMFTERVQQLGKLADQLAKQLQEQAPQEAPQQQQNPELTLKLQEAQVDMQIKQAQAAQDMQIKQAQANQDLQINDAKSALEVKKAMAQAMTATKKEALPKA